MERFQRRGSLQKRMLLAFVLIALATAAVGVVLVLSTQHFAARELEQTGQSILRQDMQSVESMLSTLDRLSMDFATGSGYLWQFMNARRQTAYNEYKMKLQFDRFYETLQKLYPQGVSLYLNSNNTRMIYLNGYLFSHGALGDELLLREAFSSETGTWQAARGVPVYQSYKNAPQKSVVALVRPYLPGGDMGVYVGVEVIAQILQPSLPTQDSQLYLFTGEGELVASVGEGADEPPSELIFGGESGPAFSASSMLVSLKSDYTGWFYAIRIPRSQGFALVSSFGAILGLCLGLYALFTSSIWTALFFHPYRAITKMAEQLRSSASSIHQRPLVMDEVLYLRTALSNLICEGDNLRREVDVYKPAMRAQLIGDLLHPGHVLSFPRHLRLLEDSGVPIHDKGFAVLLLRSAHGFALPEYAELVRALLPFRGQALAPVCIEREDGGALVLLSASTPLSAGEARAFVEEYLAALELHAGVAVGIGSPCADFMGIPISYREAQSALARCLLLEGQGIMEFSATAESPSPNEGLPLLAAEMEAVIDALRRCEAEGAFQALDALFARIAALRLDPPTAKSLCAQTLMQGMELCARFDATLTALSVSHPEGLLTTLEGLETLREMRLFAREIFAELVRMLSYRKNNLGSVRLAQSVVSYLDVHYTDSELSASRLAETFRVSPEHISRVFKENTGVNLLRYLTKLRIERAKAILMEEKSPPLAVVAERVGYQSAQTFARAFKKEEGIPPGSFKQEQTLARNEQLP
ncbi:MAG: helix-turn-helix domain-containing protein [Christensenellaceae bacterium]|jgi:AraC-like DNA-binding protein|nr:helix-turn-helix domain-containing protein [Christensenellaceae bacterium]